jgi:IMP cyclohydrolase
MYVGRIVAVGRTPEGKAAALYRVSSRSFPNRHAVDTGKSIAIVPTPGHESDIQRNPYIAYNCQRVAQGYCVVSNGSHTDPVAEKLDAGMNPRDALATVMLAMDYEHDSLDTPRITGIVSPDGARGWLAIVRKDALIVREFALNPGECYFVSTYETNEPGAAQREGNFTAGNAEACCDFILGGGIFADFERPVSAVCAVAEDGAWKVATK